MEESVGTVETVWEKMAVGTKTEMEKKMTQTEKTTAKTEKRMVETQQTIEGTRETIVVNEKTEWEYLYQNRCNIRQTDGRMILYNLKKRKMNQE
jgi:ABC-type Fe3+-citrate transport system substrate-binding protein